MIKNFYKLIDLNHHGINCSLRLSKLLAQNGRYMSTEQVFTPDEQKLVDKLKASLNTTDVDVRDISGGCGAMYEVSVKSDDFRGKSIIKQHRMVNEILKDDVKEMHGLRIMTSVPKS